MNFKRKFTIAIAIIVVSLAFICNVAHGEEEQSSCLPTLFHFDYYLDWTVENRGYPLIAPPYWFDSPIMKTVFMYPAFEDYGTRKEFYRKAFVDAMLQGALTERLNQDAKGRAEVINTLQDISGAASLSSDAVSLLNGIIKIKGNYPIPDNVQDLINEIAAHANSEILQQRLSLFGACLSTVGFFGDISCEAWQDMLLHSFVTAGTLERIEALDYWFDESTPPDQAMWDGYLLAKVDVMEYVNYDPNILRSAINNIISEPGVVLIKSAKLALEWSQVLRNSPITPQVANIAGGIFTIALAVEDLISTDIGNYKVLCAEAAIDSWLHFEVENYPWLSMPASDCRQTRRLYYQTQMIRFALSYSSFKLHDDMFEFRWSLTGLGKLLSDMVTFRYDDVATLRNEVLEPRMNSIIDLVLDFQEHFQWEASVAPLIISYDVSSTNSPEVNIRFSKNMDETTFNSECISVVGSSSGSHNPMPSYNHESYTLILNPIGEFNYVEDVLVTINSCVKSIDGVLMELPYTFTFAIEPEPQILISTWSGKNGSIIEDQYVSNGDDIIITASPQAGYQVDKWYIDGTKDQEGGNSYSLNNIQTSHSVGVTFKKILMAAITVTAPNGDETFALNSRMAITWSWKNTVGNNVKIELLANGDYYMNVVESTSNDGSYLWNVSSGVVIGEHFRVKVQSIDNPVISDISDYDFNIVNEIEIPDTIYCSTCAELQAIGSDAAHPPDKLYVLASDISCQGFDFHPIGTGSDNYFRGIFDGNGHTISELKYRDTTVDYVGLFSVIKPTAIIRNLTLTNTRFKGKENVGAFAGENQGRIMNCVLLSTWYQDTYVRGFAYIGGIAGINRGSIRECHVGLQYGEFHIIAEQAAAGGIAGINGLGSGSIGTIELCQVDDIEIISLEDYAGGIAGRNEDLIHKCGCNSTYVRAYDWGCGGIVGWNQPDGQIICCYFGENSMIIGETFNGQIAGWFEGGIIDSCYACGSFECIDSRGGLVGRCGGTIANSIWDIQHSGCSNANYDGSCNFDNVNGETTFEMKKETTYTTKYGTNWDFNNIWAIDEGNGYPKLRGIGESVFAPEGIFVSNGDPAGVYISWDPVTYYLAGADQQAFYAILRTDAPTMNSKIAELSLWQQNTTFIDETAHPDATYFYWLKAAATPDGARESAISGPYSGHRTHPPVPAPTEVTSSDGFVGSVLIEWEAVDANYYKVYRAPMSVLKGKTESEAIKEISEPITDWQQSRQVVDLPAVAGELYVYSIVSALDSTGLAEGPLSMADSGFYIVANVDGPEINLSMQPQLPIEGQPVNIVLIVQDDSIIDSVQLHWSALIDSVESWEIGDTNYFDIQYSIGPFEAGVSLGLSVLAFDNDGNISIGNQFMLVVSSDYVSTPLQPSGEKYLQPDETFEFMTGGSTSASGDGLEYRFDWGDSTFSEWGDSVAIKNWSVDGIHLIRVQARSISHPDNQSLWSNPWPVWIDITPPIVNIVTNGGRDYYCGLDTVMICGEASEQLPGSGIDSVYELSGAINEGNNSNWGFKIPLVALGQNKEIIIAARDMSGNVGLDTINVTKVIADYMISGRIFYVSRDSVNCADYDPIKQKWIVGIDSIDLRLYNSEYLSIVMDVSPDSCGYYSFSVPRGNYWMAATGTYYDSILYYFDTTYFDTVAYDDISGINVCFGDWPFGVPTDITDIETPIIPESYQLSQNYPNPFNPDTKIEFSLPKDEFVVLEIYDILGRNVRTLIRQHLSAGYKIVEWDGKNDDGLPVASGTYFYRMIIDEQSISKKMTLIK